jgi:hypothetical protein
MHRGFGRNSNIAVPPAKGSGCSIEAMPYGILEHILGFLPAPESVRTCVLRRHLWRFATGMRVGCGDDFPTPVRECRVFMDRVLLGGESPLDTCEFNLGEFQHEDVPRVHHWLRHAMMRKVRVFSLNMSPEDYPTPYLELDDQPLASQHLTRLDLTFVQTRNSFLDFSSCPSLEYLVLEYCEFWSDTKISSKSVRGRLVPFSVFLARLPSARLPPVRLSACIVSLFGCVHIQSQAREIRRLVACTR